MIEKEKKGKNLFEVNGIKYIDNIPNGMRISLTKEQYAEYLQQKELIERLLKEITKLQEIVRLQNEDSIPKYKIKELIVTLGQHKNDKIDVTITYKDAIDTAITALGELLEEG